MHATDLHRSLPSLFSELVFGAPETGAYILNRGDPGLLKSLDRLNAQDASRSSQGGATVAAHAAHLAFGLSLLNRWAGGEANPFAGANWGKAWEVGEVDETEWAGIKRELQGEVERWHRALQSERAVSGMELDGVIGSIAHLAYHLGAIRQVVAEVRGPKAND